MGVFTRPDSKWWWLWLETAPRGQQKERTRVLVGKTVTQRTENKRLALDVYHRRMNEIASKIHHLPARRATITFVTWVTWWQTNKLPHRKGRGREAEILETLVGAFGPCALTTIDVDRVAEWMTIRRRAVSARTVNREIDLLKTLLRDAAPTHMDASPLRGMKRLAVVIPKRRLLLPSEERKLLPRLRVDDRAIFLMGLDTLVRLGDILDLRREDDHGRTLYIRDPKDPQQATPFEVPVSKRLRVALNAVPKTDSPFYFPRRRQAATEAGRRAVIRSALHAACTKAGLLYGRVRGGITFHWGTRRTGASRMIHRNVDIKTVQAIGHWKHPDVVLEIYAETTTAAMRKAVELVGSDSRRIPVRGRR